MYEREHNEENSNSKMMKSPIYFFNNPEEGLKSPIYFFKSPIYFFEEHEDSDDSVMPTVQMPIEAAENESVESNTNDYTNVELQQKNDEQYLYFDADNCSLDDALQISGVEQCRNIMSDGWIVFNKTEINANINNNFVLQGYNNQESELKTENTDTVSSRDTEDSVELEKNAINYCLEPVYKEVYFDSHGKHLEEEDRIKIQISFRGINHEPEEFYIKSTEVPNIVGIVERKYIYVYATKTQKERNSIENDFRAKTYNLQEVYCYKEAGWHYINGKHIFVHRGLSLQGMNFFTELDLPFDKTIGINALSEIFRYATLICGRKEVAYTLVTYSFLGVTYEIFSEAGYDPRFLLFVLGKTGSYKTSIAKIFYTQLSEEKYRFYPRRIDADTPTALEVALTQKGKDTVTLLDDFSPAQTIRQRNSIAEKLEMIIRIVGDGSTKSRSNSYLEDNRGKGLKGMVAITGELKGGGLSSNLRCLYCEIDKNEVNTEILSFFQKNRNVYPTLIQHFIYYLVETWEEQVAMIRNKFENDRKEAGKMIKAGRLIDTLVTMHLMVDIIDGFLKRYCNSNIDSQWKEEAKTGIELTVLRSEQMSDCENPTKAFMKMLINMMTNGGITISEGLNAFIHSENSDGYLEKDYYYMLPEKIYKKVTSELYYTKKQFVTPLEDLSKILCNEGYLIPISNGGGKKTYYARIATGNGKKTKFWKIPQKIVEQLMEED